MKDIEENNKMISTYVGGTFNKYSVEFKDFGNLSGCNPYFFDDLQFHTSFDWLMPVIQKIIQWDNTDNKMYSNSIVNDLKRIRLGSDISVYYDGVVRFIKWYNEHKDNLYLNNDSIGTFNSMIF